MHVRIIAILLATALQCLMLHEEEALAQPGESATWRPLSGPQRMGASGVFDPTTRAWFVFGGFDPQFRADLWKIEPFSSTPATLLLGETSGPSPRAAAAATLDTRRGRLVVFGGTDAPFNGFFNDAWTCNLSPPHAWAQLLTAGTPPAPRAFHSACYDSVRDRMIVFGGRAGLVSDYTRYNDIWTLSLGSTPTWTQITPGGAPPPPTAEHSAVYDPIQNRLIVFGGESEAGPITFTNSTYVLTFDPTPQWTQLLTTNNPPPGCGHAAVLAGTPQKLVVMGGQ